MEGAGGDRYTNGNQAQDVVWPQQPQLVCAHLPRASTVLLCSVCVVWFPEQHWSQFGVHDNPLIWFEVLKVIPGMVIFQGVKSLGLWPIHRKYCLRHYLEPACSNLQGTTAVVSGTPRYLNSGVRRIVCVVV